MKSVLPFSVKIIFEKDSKDAPFVAYSPELDLASAGPTEESARKNLREAIQLVLEGAKADGNLEELLVENGFSREKGLLKAPKITTEEVSLTV